MTQLVVDAGFGALGVRRSRDRLLRRALFASTALVGFAAASPATAGNYIAGTYADLMTATAIANADANAGSTITLTGNITLTGLLPAISQATTIVGAGNTIDGGGAYRIFFVDAGTATVSLQNVVLQNGLAQGGAGANGGGGMGGSGGGGGYGGGGSGGGGYTQPTTTAAFANAYSAVLLGHASMISSAAPGSSPGRMSPTHHAPGSE